MNSPSFSLCYLLQARVPFVSFLACESIAHVYDAFDFLRIRVEKGGLNRHLFHSLNIAIFILNISIFYIFFTLLV